MIESLKEEFDRGYNLEDDIVLDSLNYISEFLEDYGVVGGIGVSLHLADAKKDENLRKTDDIDISIYPQPTKSEFLKNFGYRMRESLEEKGYVTEFKIPKLNYEILIRENPDHPFFLHFSRRSKKYLNRFKDRLKREIENVCEIKIPNKENSIDVLRPEDLIIPKLIRRKEKDLYDIGWLVKAKAYEIDKNYLEEVATDWFQEEKIAEDMLNIFNKYYQKYRL